MFYQNLSKINILDLMGTKSHFYGNFRLVLRSKWVPRVMGEHQGVGVRVGGGGDHGELGPMLSFKTNLGLFTFHHVQALVVASTLTYGNPYFLPPSGPRQPNNKVCKMARAPCNVLITLEPSGPGVCLGYKRLHLGLSIEG